MLLLGCQNDLTSVDGPISAYRDRMLVQHQEETNAPEAEGVLHPSRTPVARPVPAQAQLPPRESLMTQPTTTSQPAPADVLIEVPDPTEAPALFAQRLEQLCADQANRQEQRVIRNYERVISQAIEYLKNVSKPVQLRLSLSDCIQRAIENNYTIRIQAHNPAISQTQIVEAEAAFDAEFFLNTNWSALDTAVMPHAYPGTSDTRSVQGGFRKLLATGATASVSLATQRQWSGLPQGQVKTWNPTWPSNFVVQLQQPLLRGFGLDVNRAQINISKVQYQISYETFIQQVRDTLLNVEQSYWQLVRTRRQVAIVSESVAQNLITYQNMVERLEHDATQVEVENSRSQWQSSYVSYLESVKLVRDAEDQLKNFLNDPALKLSQEIEIVPTDAPVAAPTVLDHFAEVRTALESRSEIRQAKQQIDSTRINTMLTKNAILPQLNVSFQYEVQGLGDSADHSFDNLTTNRFISYTLGVNFTYPLGERRARAQYKRARLQESQAVVALNQVTDAVVVEVNNSIRTLMVRYDQIPPSLEAVRASWQNLRALQARTQRIDPSYLQTELSAVGQLANTRSTLLQVLTDYSVGIVQLEKAKGTLLEYNNVAVSDAQPKR